MKRRREEGAGNQSTAGRKWKKVPRTGTRVRKPQPGRQHTIQLQVVRAQRWGVILTTCTPAREREAQAELVDLLSQVRAPCHIRKQACTVLTVKPPACWQCACVQAGIWSARSTTCRATVGAEGVRRPC